MNDYPPEIQQQAARWAIRLAEAPLDDEQELTFQHWLAQDPHHRHALEQAGMLWHGLGSLSAEQKQVLQPQPPATLPVRRVNRMTQWKIAALLLLGFSLGATWISDGILMLRSDYHAAHQVKHVTLPDGSEVDMDAGSAISLAYTSQERRVTLLQGSAWFTVAPTTTQEKRPFLVEAASGTTQALGTQFIVQNSSQTTTVGVVEHSVQVTANGQALRLDEQQAARYTEQGMTRLHGWNSRERGDWRRGLLIFDQQPLAIVIARINQYRAGTIVIPTSALRQRQVSGIFSLNELDGALQTIATELGAKTVSLPGVTLLY
ncbi:FecR family protein [Pectobacterium odoriferum]|uniref:Iron dicitrate transport regulator FecR n=1 Tax=Pectobacterium odoriferum TaxID=78398 RepID=A0ABD6VNL4_9GAMM|nr:FecR domain-containing protein [Pectobacterium odoriferum]AIU87941.1 iron dicitrate transport regulator FecR [Pectobacterium odoriferum]KGA33581.1 iron dicitrate transport regulator FecR [Pectobacterium odoriferum]MBA0186751.1 FecR domain-containing protein [Pectobacterium odoriferum]MCA6961831.1 FecR domain-containing protein [Pectobacterium odoriferum]MCH5009935.1 FecR domain-containing protein [Pectobacterium odoriferum]